MHARMLPLHENELLHSSQRHKHTHTPTQTHMHTNRQATSQTHRNPVFSSCVTTLAICQDACTLTDLALCMHPLFNTRTHTHTHTNQFLYLQKKNVTLLTFYCAAWFCMNHSLLDPSVRWVFFTPLISNSLFCLAPLLLVPFSPSLPTWICVFVCQRLMSLSTSVLPVCGMKWMLRYNPTV